MILELIERFTRGAEARNLDFLMIGGHAVMHHGYARMTLDLDLLCRDSQRKEWGLLLGEYGYSVYSETAAFAQFSGGPGWPLVDLMFVADETWGKLRSEAVFKESGRIQVAVPSVRHLIALKLHASRSATRTSPGKDWTDIEELIRLHQLDPCEAEFSAIILKYGGEEAFERLKAFWKTTDRS